MTDKSKENDNDEIVAFSQPAIAYNHAKLQYCRTSIFALSGCTAGILGLYSINGFVFYFLTAICFWLLILGKTGKNFNKYFLSKKQLLINELFGGLQTYVLFWTFLYGMVHVY